MQITFYKIFDFLYEIIISQLLQQINIEMFFKLQLSQNDMFLLVFVMV